MSKRKHPAIERLETNYWNPIRRLFDRFYNEYSPPEPETPNWKPKNPERTGHVLPKGVSKVQDALDDLVIYTRDHQMQLNKEKTKVILFNNAVKYDFLPELTLEDDTILEVVDEIRLLGVKVSADLSWRSNTSEMCKNAYARLWMLRRIKPLGASTEELLDIYDKQIRCVLEFASPVWTSGLTLAETNQIERVQKAAFAIILDIQYNSYAKSLTKLSRKTLTERRYDLNLNFARKALKSEKFNHWFCEYKPTVQVSKTRSVKDVLLVPVESRNKSFGKSPLAYLTNLINENK